MVESNSLVLSIYLQRKMNENMVTMLIKSKDDKTKKLDHITNHML